MYLVQLHFLGAWCTHAFVHRLASLHLPHSGMLLPLAESAPGDLASPGLPPVSEPAQSAWNLKEPLWGQSVGEEGQIERKNEKNAVRTQTEEEMAQHNQIWKQNWASHGTTHACTVHSHTYQVHTLTRTQREAPSGLLFHYETYTQCSIRYTHSYAKWVHTLVHLVHTSLHHNFWYWKRCMLGKAFSQMLHFSWRVHMSLCTGLISWPLLTINYGWPQCSIYE